MVTGDDEYSHAAGTAPRAHLIVGVCLALHAAWGAFIAALPVLDASIGGTQPAFALAWVSTTIMLGLTAMVLAADRWPRHGVWFLPAILLFDAAALVLLLSLKAA